MSNFQLDGEQAINDLLDQVAFVQRENAALKMQLSAAMRALEPTPEEKGDVEDVGNTV